MKTKNEPKVILELAKESDLPEFQKKKKITRSLCDRRD